MFTGIVEELGTVAGRADLPDAARLTFRGATVTADLAAGDSIAVSGVCLTVVSIEAGCFSADVMRETLDRSTLGGLRAGDPVNLERPLTPSGRLGGHLVQGHVDGVGTIASREASAHWELVRIAVPAQLAKFVAVKGSVAVDGVSLTVTELTDEGFAVGLIPTTLARTTLGRRRPGDPVNLEVDILAKYVERLLADRSGEAT